MKVKIILENGAQIPIKAHKSDAGYDLYTSKTIAVPDGRNKLSRIIVPTGLRMQMHDDRNPIIKWLDRKLNGEFRYEAQIEPRSGFSAKGVEGTREHPGCVIEPLRYRFDCDVLLGKIDEGYRDAIGIIISNHGERFFIPKGTRLAQITFVKVECPTFEEVNEIGKTDRDGGFGQSGTH